MGKRNNGLRKPFSFQTVSKQHQRCAWQWWRHPMRSRPSQSHIAPVPFSTDTAKQLQQGAGRMFMKPLQGKALWNVAGCSCSWWGMWRARCCLHGTAQPPTATQPLQGCWTSVPRLRMGQDWTPIRKPCCWKKKYFGEMRGLQPSFWSATVLFYAGVTAGLS